MNVQSRNGAVVFFHAHPDDEAIFTGGTMRLLANAGAVVVAVFATAGEAGLGDDNAQLADLRRCEARQACELLGAQQTHFLGYGDSGVRAEVETGFAHVPVDEASRHLQSVLSQLGTPIEAIIVYDSDGTYGHPDHIHVHDVGMHAANAMAIPAVYECTIDREYLHFVETHLVVSAGLGERPKSLGLAATNLGRPTVLIDRIVDVNSVLDIKRDAMELHASQLPADAPVFALGADNFAAVYGLEWFVQVRGPGPLDDLP